MLYLYAGIGLLILALGAAVKIQSDRLDTCKDEHATFVAQVKTAGDAQEAAAKLKDAANKTKMEKANNENLRTKSALAIALNSLRSGRPGSSYVPQAPAGAKRPDLACYDRTEYIGAVGSFIEAARGLADEGTAATVDLDTAKLWAR